LQERHAILTIRDGSKLDSGPYRLLAENDLGMDAAIIKIQISGMYVIGNVSVVEVVGQVMNNYSKGSQIMAYSEPVKREREIHTLICMASNLIK
jgi:hypothetical protein